jgi:hypothetical protein
MVLSHELAHTFHVEMTQGRVPRWFTEGLAELETSRARFVWRREMSRDLYAALTENSLRGIATLNEAFSHARNELEMVTAYIHATWVLRYLIIHHGYAGIRRMLDLYGRETPTVQAVREVTGLDETAFDKAFFTYLRAMFRKYEHQFLPSSIRFADGEKLEKALSSGKAPRISAAWRCITLSMAKWTTTGWLWKRPASWMLATAGCAGRKWSRPCDRRDLATRGRSLEEIGPRQDTTDSMCVSCWDACIRHCPAPKMPAAVGARGGVRPRRRHRAHFAGTRLSGTQSNGGIHAGSAGVGENQRSDAQAARMLVEEGAKQKKSVAGGGIRPAVAGYPAGGPERDSSCSQRARISSLDGPQQLCRFCKCTGTKIRKTAWARFGFCWPGRLRLRAGAMKPKACCRSSFACFRA